MTAIDIRAAFDAATIYRLTLLDRGYAPLPCAAKRGFLKGWNKIAVSPSIIRGWPATVKGGEPAVSTAVRLDGDMICIDVDIDDHAVAARVLAGIMNSYGANAIGMRRLTVDDAGVDGAKFAIFARTDEPFTRHATDKFVGRDGREHMVEAFGSARSKQMTIAGPHTQELLADGSWMERRRYKFAADIPTFRAAADLPVIKAAAVRSIIRRAQLMFESTDAFVPAPKLPPRRPPKRPRPARSGGRYSASKGVAEYIIPVDAMFQAAPTGAMVGYMQLIDMAHRRDDTRVSASWIGCGSNPSRMQVHPANGPPKTGGERGIRLYDHETGRTFLPAHWESGK